MALLKRIIPCLDVKNGRVVKGTQFVELKDMGDPLELALRYEQQGADELVLLDISASVEAQSTALKIIHDVATHLSIPFTVGGGIRTLDDIHRALDAGADKVAINSAALKNPELINRSAAHFGSQCIVVAIDYHNAQNKGWVKRLSGTDITGRNVLNWSHEAANRGAGELLLTCIDNDGTGAGFETEYCPQLANELRIPVIASGGAKNAQDFVRIFQQGADAALAAGIFHRCEITINDVKTAANLAGLPIRKNNTITE